MEGVFIVIALRPDRSQTFDEIRRGRSANHGHESLSARLRAEVHGDFEAGRGNLEGGAGPGGLGHMVPFERYAKE
ncbi:MAG: hypothetical protein NVSMB59_20440 [Vulcanimicrobiaceae bacterium]